MEKRPDTLSYHRLLDREQFYKQKALTLEKQLVMLQEDNSTLQQALKDVDRKTSEEKAAQKEAASATEKYDQLLASHKKLELRYQKITEEYAAIEMKIQESDSSLTEEKKDSYERLLKEMERLIHEQEEKLLVYQKRLAFYERQLKGVGTKGGNQPIHLDQSIKRKQQNFHAILYSDYTTIWQEKRLLVRGDCHIENIGEQALSTPLLCFRFYPGDVAAMKGKIYDTDHLPIVEAEDTKIQWMYMDNDWSKEAKERGELWLHPIQNISLEPGGTLSLKDFQIPIDRSTCPQLMIELYAYFSKEEYKIKGLHHLSMNGLNEKK